jgi:primase-polymerase (primpol)-like protein
MTITERRNHAVRTLEDLEDEPRWVAWCLEQRKGADTKVPKNPRTRRSASSIDPDHWGTRAEAQSCWTKLRVNAVEGVGGVGVVLGEFNDRYYLAGIDLDQCIDPKKGRLCRLSNASTPIAKSLRPAAV